MYYMWITEGPAAYLGGRRFIFTKYVAGQYFAAWKDIVDAILKFRRQIKNHMHPYLREEHSCQI